MRFPADLDAMELRGTVAQNIRDLAEKRGIGLNALADLAGVSRSQLFNVLGATSSASIDWLDLVAEALDVDAYVLMKP